jgi:hypothetical protein
MPNANRLDDEKLLDLIVLLINPAPGSQNRRPGKRPHDGYGGFERTRFLGCGDALCDLGDAAGDRGGGGCGVEAEEGGGAV